MTLETSNVTPVYVQPIQLFEKRTVAELSDEQMMAVDGGTTFACGFVAGFTAALLLKLL
jgi:hypothetical protein